jgi:hypothetical protein
MLTVRFPDGTAVQYNRANRVHYINTQGGMLCMRLVYKAGDAEHWIADVIGNCIIESESACSITNPIKDSRSMLRFVIDNIRSFDSYPLSELKRKLRKFNSQYQCWKD